MFRQGDRVLFARSLISDKSGGQIYDKFLGYSGVVAQVLGKPSYSHWFEYVAKFCSSSFIVVTEELELVARKMAT